MRYLITVLALALSIGAAQATTAPMSAIGSVPDLTEYPMPMFDMAQAAPAAEEPVIDQKVTIEGASSVIDWIVAAATSLIGIAITWGIALIGGPAAGAIRTFGFDKTMKRAAAAGIAKAAAELKHKLGPNGEITLEVKNRAVEYALEYANKYMAPALKEWGKPTADKALARVEEAINSTLTNYVDANVGKASTKEEVKATVNIKQPTA